MNRSIDVMAKKLYAILGDNIVCIYLYGSVVMDDFKLGWSHIDILCLTKEVHGQKMVYYNNKVNTWRINTNEKNKNTTKSHTNSFFFNP